MLLAQHPLFHDIHLNLGFAQKTNIKVREHVFQILNKVQVSGVFFVMVFHGNKFWGVGQL